MARDRVYAVAQVLVADAGVAKDIVVLVVVGAGAGVATDIVVSVTVDEGEEVADHVAEVEALTGVIDVISVIAAVAL